MLSIVVVLLLLLLMLLTMDVTLLLLLVEQEDWASVKGKEKFMDVGTKGDIDSV